jgi:hypothetical protein
MTFRQEAHVYSHIKTLTGVAAAAVLGAVLMAGTARLASAQAPAAQQAAQPGQPAAQPAKTPKDQAETDIANAVFIDILSATPNWQKAVTDLTAWVQKYPESDWKNERPLYFLQAYNGLNQKDKALEYAAQLLATDVPAAIKDPSDVLKVYLYASTSAIGIQNATPQQLATGDKGAHALLAYIPTFFTAANKSAGVTDAQWASTRKSLEDIGSQAELYVATYAPDQAAAAGAAAAKDAAAAKAKGDANAAQVAGAKAKAAYSEAEQGYRQALKSYPDSWSIAYSLGSAILQQQTPDTFPQGLYFIARADAMDPAKGGIPDAAQRAKIDTFLKNAYVSFHGADDGLAELKQQALASAFPPADFKIKTSAEIAMEKQKAFQDKYPELALWMGIKGMLAGADGDAQFASMKDSLVKGLKGKIVSGSPECRSKEILVAVPEPDQTTTPRAELTLKLDKPLTGKPVAGTEIKWDGQPAAFTKEPFMLTMNVDQADIQGMATDPCTPPAAKKTGVGTKKPAVKK